MSRRHRWSSLGLAVVVIVPRVAAGQPARGASNALSARIDQIFAPWDRPGSPGCAVGVGRDGRVLYTHGYGSANLEYDVPITAASIFESGSVAKQFTAAAIVLLAQDGKLSLDDDIRKYLPEVPDFGDTIRVRHLLTHTSGLRDQWELLAIEGRGPGRRSTRQRRRSISSLIRRRSTSRPGRSTRTAIRATRSPASSSSG